MPTSNMVSPIVTPVIPIGSPMMVQLQVEAAPSSSLCLSQLSSLPRLSSSQSPPQQPSTLYLPRHSSAISPPHPSLSLCLPQPPSITILAIMPVSASALSEACIPAVPSKNVVSAYVVPYSIGSPSRCPLCPSVQVVLGVIGWKEVSSVGSGASLEGSASPRYRVLPSVVDPGWLVQMHVDWHEPKMRRPFQVIYRFFCQQVLFFTQLRH